MTIDYTKILSDMQYQYSKGIPFERIINDLWYAIQAEIDLLMENVIRAITEEFMRIIKDSKSSEPTKFRTLRIRRVFFLVSKVSPKIRFSEFWGRFRGGSWANLEVFK